MSAWAERGGELVWAVPRSQEGTFFSSLACLGQLRDSSTAKPKLGSPWPWLCLSVKYSIGLILRSNRHRDTQRAQEASTYLSIKPAI